MGEGESQRDLPALCFLKHLQLKIVTMPRCHLLGYVSPIKTYLRTVPSYSRRPRGGLVNSGLKLLLLVYPCLVL